MKNSLKYRNLNRTKQRDTEQRKEKNDRSLPMNKIHTHSNTTTQRHTAAAAEVANSEKIYIFYCHLDPLYSAVLDVISIRFGLSFHMRTWARSDLETQQKPNEWNE